MNSTNFSILWVWLQLFYLFRGGFTGDEDMFGTTLLQQKALENGEDKVLNSSSFRVPVLDVKQESTHYYRQVDDEFQACKSSWPQLIPVSSPNSCITSLSNSFLNFSSSKGNRKNQNPDQYSSKVGEISVPDATFFSHKSMKYIFPLITVWKISGFSLCTPKPAYNWSHA